MIINEFEQVMKAVGDPTRARMLKLLEGGELCVSQLMEAMKLGQSTASSHLAVLLAAGMIGQRREGRRRWYALSARARNRYAPALQALLLGWLDDDPRVRADKRRLAALGTRGR